MLKGLLCEKLPVPIRTLKVCHLNHTNSLEVKLRYLSIINFNFKIRTYICLEGQTEAAEMLLILKLNLVSGPGCAAFHACSCHCNVPLLCLQNYFFFTFFHSFHNMLKRYLFLHNLLSLSIACSNDKSFLAER